LFSPITGETYLMLRMRRRVVKSRAAVKYSGNIERRTTVGSER
jgi:hypothetical protein